MRQTHSIISIETIKSFGETELSKKKSINEKFWSKVSKEPNGCWNWTACKNNKGYGGLCISGKYVMAHRFSWELHNSKIPKNLEVLHTCDNPSCVNPAHMKLGTKKNNMQEAVSKRRIAHSEKNGKTKLNTEQVIRIRKLHTQSHCTVRYLADLYSVSYGCIYQIVNYKRWVYV